MKMLIIIVPFLLDLCLNRSSKKTTKKEKRGGLTKDIAHLQFILWRAPNTSTTPIEEMQYAGLIKVIPKSPAELTKAKAVTTETTTAEPSCATIPSTTEEVKHRGRQPNGCFSVNSNHPLFVTHEQQIRSKHFIPIAIGVPPCPPGKRRSNMTDAWILQARKFAKYILTLFRPWDEDNGRLPGVLTWKAFCEFLQQLRNGPKGKGAIMLGRIRLAWIGNMSRGLRMTTVKRVAATQYRMRNATVLGQPDGTSAIVKPIIKEQNDPPFGYDEDIDQDSDRSKDRKFDPNDPTTAIEMLRMETAADDLLQRRNATELAFHEATLHQLKLSWAVTRKPLCNHQ